MAEILLINQDEMDNNLLLFICKLENCSLSIAGSAEEALQKMTKTRFDMVVCDYHLPGMNGLDFFNRIPPEHGALVKVLLAQGVTPDIMHAAFEIGVHECLRKPLTFSGLESIFTMIDWKTGKERQ